MHGEVSPTDVDGVKQIGGEESFVDLVLKFVDDPDGAEVSDEEHGEKVACHFDLRVGECSAFCGFDPYAEEDEGEACGHEPENDFSAVLDHFTVIDPQHRHDTSGVSFHSGCSSSMVCESSGCCWGSGLEALALGLVGWGW